jgi:PST family polysaccharide transporter
VLLLNIDYVVVTRALGEDANGLYSYAYRFAFVPYVMIAVVLSGVAFPVYTRIIARNLPAGGATTVAEAGRAVAPALRRVVHVMLASAGGLYLLLALLSPRIVVIDERWAPSAPVLAVLCGYGLLLCLELVGYDALRAIGRPSLFLAAQLSHVVLLTVLAVLVVRGVGWADGAPTMDQAIVAVAGAQVLAVGLVVVSVLATLARYRVVNAATLAVLRGPGLAALATVAVWVGVQVGGVAPPAASLTGLLWLGALLTGVYAGVLMVADRGALAEIKELRRQ